MGWLGDGSHRGQGCQAWTAVGLPPRYPYALHELYPYGNSGRQRVNAACRLNSSQLIALTTVVVVQLFTKIHRHSNKPNLPLDRSQCSFKTPNFHLLQSFVNCSKMNDLKFSHTYQSLSVPRRSLWWTTICVAHAAYLGLNFVDGRCDLFVLLVSSDGKVQMVIDVFDCLQTSNSARICCMYGYFRSHTCRCNNHNKINNHNVL